MKVTVFTPTYNRGYIISNAYESLKTQIDTNFEWLIIDDGSTDNTEALVKDWQNATNLFEIRYVKTQNGGKHRAINKGLSLANGQLFFILDSDDYLTSDCIHKLRVWGSKVGNDNSFAGISGNRGYSTEKLIGTTFEGKSADLKITERKRFGISGDKAEAYFTDILKQFPFPEFEGENFISENSVWLHIAISYKLRYFNDIIYICNYLSDGLSKNIQQIELENPKGAAYVLRQNIQSYRFGVKSKLSAYYYYYKIYKERLHRKEILENLKITELTLLTATLIFAGKNKLLEILK